MATPSNPVPENYVLGQSNQEYQRLMMQARILRPFTERYFRSAGLVPGMSVLDLGAGIGDVSLLAGDIVGSGGRVLGLDRDGAALEYASQRAAQQGSARWVQFQTTNLEDFKSDAVFDAVVGRYILLYQPDAGATIRQLTRFLKPGGIIVFHELIFGDPGSSHPPCSLWDEMYATLGESFRRAGAPPDFGRRVGKAFLDAGLPFPQIDAVSVAGGGPGSFLYAWIADTIRSVAPRMAQLGLKMPDGLAADEHLAAKLEASVIASGSQIIGPMQIGAWTRKA